MATHKDGVDGLALLAIVGMSCRFSGNATSPEKLYEMCAEGRDGWSEVPTDRYNIDAFHHSDSERYGAVNMRGGHFLREDLERFDANFFNVTASEAKVMDPQQRILLECTYEALTNAGLTMQSATGSHTGVFVGSGCRDYREEVFSDPEQITAYSSTGTEQSILSNRISYFFNLKGPSVSVDTACSSSLSAFHLACQSLRAGETKQAIVGGSNIIIGPHLTIAFSRLGLLSPDGRSFAFGDRANGYGRGEGVGCVVVKTLEEAQRNGDTIRAVIRNTGMNSDGRTSSLTAPSGDAQMQLIRDVYANAGLNPLHTHYVEAHGTGTPVGDPTEARALAHIFGVGRGTDEPLLIGSIKTNLGHLEGASGIAGLIKTVLMLEKGVILPSINHGTPSKDIPFEALKLRVPTETEDWKHDVRRASVNSFGFGGANAHVILEDARKYQPRPCTISDRLSKDGNQNGFPNQRSTESTMELAGKKRERVFLLSANDVNSGRDYARRLADYVNGSMSSDHDTLMKNLAFTLAQRRSLHSTRLFVTAKTIEDLTSALLHEDLQFAKKPTAPNLTFLFTGQGAQWAGMATELIEVYPSFGATLKAAEKCLIGFGASWSLIEELRRDGKSSRIGSAFIAQPLTTALQIALVDLLESWNIKPSLVVGHSSGEIAAAYAVGALDLRTCLKIAYHRGLIADELQQTRPGLRGAMLAVGMASGEVEPLLSKLIDGHAIVACVNSSFSTTVSGDEAAIQELQAILNLKQKFVRRLDVNVAYHSHHMSIVRDKYSLALGSVTPNASSTIKMFSSVTGTLIEPAKLSAEYWARNLASPVIFAEALESLCASSQDATSTALNFVEIGPHAILGNFVRDHLVLHHQKITDDSLITSALYRQKDPIDTTVNLVTALLSRGYDVDIGAVNSTETDGPHSVLVDLPPYSWNHKERYWHHTRTSRDYRLRKHPRDDLIGTIARDSTSFEPRWRNIIRAAEMPWIRDHVIQSQIIFPAAGFAAMAVQACHQHMSSSPSLIVGYALRQMSVLRALIIPRDSDATEVMLSLRPYSESHKAVSDVWFEFTISSWSIERDWTEHCRGLVSARTQARANEVDEADHDKSTQRIFATRTALSEERCQHFLDAGRFYGKLRRIGMEFGSTFKGLNQIYAAEGVSKAIFPIPNTALSAPLEHEHLQVIHPATLDTIFQTAFAAISGTIEKLDKSLVLVFIDELFVSTKLPRDPGQELQVHTQMDSKSSQDIMASGFVLEVGSNSFDPVLIWKGLRGRLLSPDLPEKLHSDKICFQEEWSLDVNTLASDETLTFSTKANDVDHLDKEQQMKMEETATRLVHAAYSNFKVSSKAPPFPHLKRLYKWIQKEVSSSEGQEYQRKLTETQLAMVSHDSQTHQEALLFQMGQAMPRILKGEISAQYVLSQNHLMSDWYASNSSYRRAYHQAAKHISLLANKNPQLRILDLGGGAAAASAWILEVVATSPKDSGRIGLYEFVASSSSALDEARTELRPWADLVRFTKFNIERKAASQGFTDESYDVIVASNILVGTTNVDQTMTNVRQLLKSNGTLILVEIANPVARHFVMFGGLPSWWLGEDECQKQQGPLNNKEWTKLLQRANFNTLVMGITDPSVSSCEEFGVIIADSHKPKTRVFPNIVTLVSNRSAEDLLVKRMSAELGELTGHTVVLSSLASLKEVKGIFIVLLEFDGISMTQMTSQHFKEVRKIIDHADGLLWLTKHDSTLSLHAGKGFVTGLARVLKLENSLLNFVTLHMEASTLLSDDAVTRAILKVFSVAFSEDPKPGPVDREYLLRDNCLMIPRVYPDPNWNKHVADRIGESEANLQRFQQESRRLRMDLGVPGLLNTLVFVDDERGASPLADDYIEVEIAATGINFRDIMLAAGQLEFDVLGIEFSGTVSATGREVAHLKNGDRVLGIASGTYANYVCCHAAAVQVIPAGIAFEHAASIPVAFCTAYYALYDIARLRCGESLLIHSASGAVGQAAIMLAQLIGARIFATVGSEKKKSFLMKEYNIPAQDIFYSRDNTFADAIMTATANAGVDVILNSKAGDALRVTWDCIALFGRFIEIGKRDIQLNTRLEMSRFSRNVMFASVDIYLMLQKRVHLLGKLLSDVMELIKRSDIRPVHPVQVWPVSDVEGAFRTMQNGTHIGKLVIMPKEDDLVRALPPKVIGAKIDPTASYLLVGGLGGIGRSVAMWLVRRGARNLIFASRSGPSSAHAALLVAEIQGYGARAAVYACDVADVSQLRGLLAQSATQMPPIRGVIQAAMVLRDSLFEKTSFEDFMAVVNPKVQGTINLHECLLRTDLDFFVMLSSVSGIVGNIGQAAYAGSSTWMDGFAKYRRQLGLPAVSLDLGVVQDVGYVAENHAMQSALDKSALDQISEAELLALMDLAIKKPTDGQDTSQIITGLGMRARKSKQPLPSWTQDPRFAALKRDWAQMDDTPSAEVGRQGLSEQLQDCASFAEGVGLVTTALLAKIAEITTLPVEELDRNKSASAYGLDSLAGVELRNWLRRELGANLHLFELLTEASIANLAGTIVGKSTFFRADLKDEPAAEGV